MKFIFSKKITKKTLNYPSLLVIWLSLIIIAYVNYDYKNWNNEQKIIAFDVNSYYAYLPIVIIHQDIDADFLSKDIKKHGKHFWLLTTQTNKKAVLTSMGMSFLYAPFFLAGHAYAQMTSFEADGFSAPYKIALILSCLFYLFLGLIFLRKALKIYFSEWVTSIVLIIIIFGTNLLHYTTEEPTMPHAYNFSLISILLFTTIKWFEKPGAKYAILIGALSGLIVLIRPTNILIIILLFFWGVTSMKCLGNRIRFYLKHYYLVLIMISVIVIIWIPQFLYWNYVSGSIFLNVYDDRGQTFFFNNPQIYHILFSYRKGWFVYTPLMFVSLFGFIFLYKNHRGIFWPIIIYLTGSIYILASWWAWWNGGSFGLRSFIDLYGLMAFPLAALITFVFKQKFWISVPALLIIIAMTSHNIYFTRMFKKNFLDYVSMTKTSYWEVFLDRSPNPDYWDNLSYPDYEAAKRGEYYTKFEIPRGLEKKFGMRGREYFNLLQDSIASDSIYMNQILNEHHSSGLTREEIISFEAEKMFDRIVQDYYTLTEAKRNESVFC